jgi:hypothetical protein
MIKHPAMRPRAATLLVSVLLLACGDDGMGPQVPARIVLLPETPAVFQGLTSRLSATVLDTGVRVIRGATVHYSSSDPGILTIDRDGTMHSVGALGSARITAEFGGLTSFVDVPILERVGSIEVRPESLVLNRTLRAYIEFYFLSKSGRPYTIPGLVSFTSANPRIVTVDQGDVVAGNTSGKTTITIAVDTFVVKVPVRVTQFPASITAEPAGVLLQPGASKALTVTVLDSAGLVIESPPLTFTSNDPTLFSVSNAGRVSSRGPAGSGTLTIALGRLSIEVGVLVGAARTFSLAHTTQVDGSLYEAEIGPADQVVISTRDRGHVVRGTLPAFTLSATIGTGASPLGVAINHAGTRSYVASGDELSVIDLGTNTALSPIAVPGGGGKIAVAISGDDQRAYLSTAQYVYSIDLAAGTVTDSVALLGGFSLVLHPDQSLLYAAEATGLAVMEIDVSTMTIIRTLTRNTGHGDGIQEIAVSPDGTELYAADGADALIVFDLQSGAPVHTVTLDDNGFGLAASQHLIAVSTFNGIQIFDRNSRVRLARIGLGGLPGRPAISQDESMIVVPNQGGWADYIH